MGLSDSVTPLRLLVSPNRIDRRPPRVRLAVPQARCRCVGVQLFTEVPASKNDTGSCGGYGVGWTSWAPLPRGEGQRDVARGRFWPPSNSPLGREAAPGVSWALLPTNWAPQTRATLRTSSCWSPGQAATRRCAGRPLPGIGSLGVRSRRTGQCASVWRFWRSLTPVDKSNIAIPIIRRRRTTPLATRPNIRVWTALSLGYGSFVGRHHPAQSKSAPTASSTESKPSRSSSARSPSFITRAMAGPRKTNPV